MDGLGGDSANALASTLLSRDGLRGVLRTALIVVKVYTVLRFDRNPLLNRMRGTMSQTGKLTTHVLDTMHGVPAANMTVTLYEWTGQWQVIKQVQTNADGRTNEPLLAGEALKSSRYRLEFDVEGYFRSKGLDLPEPAFLSLVPIDFGIANPGVAYHVPLLISPWVYSTYRGS